MELNSFQTALACSKVFMEFGLPSAVKQCEEYLKHPVNITVDNAISLYEMDRPDFVEKCLKYFASNTRQVLESVAFSRARLDTILAIFDLPKLNISSELDLLDVLRNFAEMHGALPSHAIDGNESRFTELVKPALEKVRLMTLTAKDIVSSESVRSLFTNEQILGVLANLIVPENTLFKVPEGVSLCKEYRGEQLDDQSCGQFSDFVQSTINESSVEILANTAEINSQLYETPKSSQQSNTQEHSVDWTPNKVQNLQSKSEVTQTPENVGTPIGNSTIDSTVFVEEVDNTLTGEM